MARGTHAACHGKREISASPTADASLASTLETDAKQQPPEAHFPKRGAFLGSAKPRSPLSAKRLGVFHSSRVLVSSFFGTIDSVNSHGRGSPTEPRAPVGNLV
mmetsp:Transcript_139515/g.433951  ORF Transcript_139515/g.433951 Transcript_139515/m.433951 type:complete len:103 (+) Transcript_139515:44-352(+)